MSRGFRSLMRWVALSASVVLLAIMPALALAEPVALGDDPLEVQIWPGGQPGSTLLIVTGHIPQGAALPATVRLPLPDGTEVVWAGEILGGPVAEDPARAWIVVDAGGGRALELTAEATRTVQYEAVAGPLTTAGGATTSVFVWSQSVDTGDVVFSVRVPAGVGEVSIDPMPVGDPLVNEAGESLYTLSPVMLTAGDSFTVTTTYGSSSDEAGSVFDSPLLPVLLGVLAFAVLALVLAVARGRKRPA